MNTMIYKWNLLLMTIINSTFPMYFHLNSEINKKFDWSFHICLWMQSIIFICSVSLMQIFYIWNINPMVFIQIFFYVGFLTIWHPHLTDVLLVVTVAYEIGFHRFTCSSCNNSNLPNLTLLRHNIVYLFVST